MTFSTITNHSILFAQLRFSNTITEQTFWFDDISLNLQRYKQHLERLCYWLFTRTKIPQNKINDLFEDDCVCVCVWFSFPYPLFPFLSVASCRSGYIVLVSTCMYVCVGINTYLMHKPNRIEQCDMLYKSENYKYAYVIPLNNILCFLVDKLFPSCAHVKHKYTCRRVCLAMCVCAGLAWLGLARLCV